MAEHTFKPGDYVRCIEDFGNTDLVTKGNVYRVKSIDPTEAFVCVNISNRDDYQFSASRFQAVNVTDVTSEPEVWVVVGADPLPETFPNYEEALAYARSRCELVPNKRFYVARVQNVVLGKVLVMEGKPTFPVEIGP